MLLVKRYCTLTPALQPARHVHAPSVEDRCRPELLTLSHSHLYNDEQQSLRFVEHPYTFNILNKTIKIFDPVAMVMKTEIADRPPPWYAREILRE